MTITELAGHYNIIGSNQDAESLAYKGTLELSLDAHHRIIAKWLIHPDQVQLGTGFF